jgi:LCP family protein required for cell wall assembly
MNKQRPSIDGFIPRRTGSQLGEQHSPLTRSSGENRELLGLRPTSQLADRTLPTVLAPSSEGVSRQDLSETLGKIPSIDEPKPSRRQRREMRRTKRSKAAKIVKWSVILILILGVVLGGWFGYKTLKASGNIFKGNILDVFQHVPLKQDANGRTNILILGTSEDDPGHQGASLTDSMMILSVDQNKKNAYMMSIPRDLWVKYGTACDAGYEGKINSYYSCEGGGSGTVDQDRAALTKTGDFIGKIVGLDIQYGVNVNYTVMRDLVNAVGGITVTIESRDPQGQMDSNFDWKCGVGDRKVTRAEVLQRCPPNGHYIDYPNGPVHLDAEHALYLAQARGDSAPTYGFEQSNFDREKNQQKIIKAIREKALSGGILANPSKVSSIIDSLGNNLRTTFEAKEVQTLISLAQSIKDSDIQSISLIDATPALVTTGNYNGVSVVMPSEGIFQYDGIQAYLQKKLSSNPIVREGAVVTVLNGSGVSGAGQTEADNLTKAGFNVDSVASAPDGTYADIEVYQIGTGMSATKAKLASLYNVTVKTTKPPVTVSADTNFVVIVGKPRQTN